MQRPVSNLQTNEIANASVYQSSNRERLSTVFAGDVGHKNADLVSNLSDAIWKVLSES